MDKFQPVSPQKKSTINSLVKTLTLVITAGFTILVLGCSSGDSGPKDKVTGKVTFNGKVVAGMVVFVGADGKRIEEAIGPNGSFTIKNPPKGAAKFAVKGLPGSELGAKVTIPKMKDSSGTKMPDETVKTSEGVPPPPGYANPETSNLTFTVKGGHEKFDITLPLKK